ncbi:MAG: CatB-related O-acetyltransferase [Sumerlaeia bacterium]
MNIPDSQQRFPLAQYKGLVFLNQVIECERIIVGDYTYFDDPAGPENFEKNNVLYHFDFIGDRLIIGRYCSIARGVRFLMNGGNHSLAGFSSFPFYIFGDDWGNHVPPQDSSTNKGDTVVGNDVWIGFGATVLPGVSIGDGSIVGAGSVVTRDVEPYTIVGGNPARPIRKRFDEETIGQLLRVRWWNWPVEKVTENLGAIVRGDKEWLAMLEAASD